MSVELEDAVALLDPGPLPLEMGIARLPSGVLHVAARTDMPRCKGRMFEWWFRFAPDSTQYAWWHPLDHVSSAWAETSPTTHVGSTHIVEERLGAEEVHALQIAFHDPAELFGAEAVADALDSGVVSAFVCARIGIGEDPPRDERGRPLGARLAHIARDTPEGMVLRSRFWLGVGVPPEVPDALGLGLMQHAHTEFKYLARFLPSLYGGAHPDDETAALPW